MSDWELHGLVLLGVASVLTPLSCVFMEPSVIGAECVGK